MSGAGLSTKENGSIAKAMEPLRSDCVLQMPPNGGSPLNPLNPAESGVSVYLGTMKGDLNGKPTLFSPAYYTVDESGAMNVIAYRVNDKIFQHILSALAGTNAYSVSRTS